jgi:hypothetical protein
MPHLIEEIESTILPPPPPPQSLQLPVGDEAEKLRRMLRLVARERRRRQRLEAR